MPNTIASDLLKTMHKLHEDKNHQHWRTKIADSKSSTNKLWRTLSNIMRENKTTDCNDKVHTDDEFAKFFSYVEIVRTSTSSVPLQNIPYTATHNIDARTAATTSDVEAVISSTLSKTCQLDPAPTWLAKNFRRLLSPFITLLFNKSLVTGHFPAKYKHTIISPL